MQGMEVVNMGNEEIIAEMNAKKCGQESAKSLITFYKSELIEALDKARAEGRREFICRNCGDIWNVDTSDEFEAGRQSAHNDLKERIGKLKEDLLKSYSTASDEMQAHICCVIETVDEIFPEAKKRRL